ncbi:MAG: transcription elongation factor Spt5 [DPANN group archaeon]|nr:transcription elongation factor Spt5 [DPANN group archaeon]
MSDKNKKATEEPAKDDVSTLKSDLPDEHEDEMLAEFNKGETGSSSGIHIKVRSRLPKDAEHAPRVEETPEEEKKPEKEVRAKMDTKLFGLRTTANREDQVMDFVSSNAAKRKLKVLSVIRPHGMRGYIFLEATTKSDAEQAAFNVPYARGILPKEIAYEEIEHMLAQVKRDINIRKNDIAEIISGPFKREKCKITRIDKTKEEVVVELLEAAVPIPITLKMDSIKVIRRDEDEDI